MGGQAANDHHDEAMKGENMTWQDEVREKQKRGNQILFGKDSPYLQDLKLLLEGQSHITLILWALELAEESVKLLKARYPEEHRPEEALLAARDWAAGRVKMRFAQRKILDCHAVAKELTDPADMALCHAIGQACAVVHTAGHVMGYPMYELSSLVYRYGMEGCGEFVERRKEEYIRRLLLWAGQAKEEKGPWASFLTK